MLSAPELTHHEYDKFDGRRNLFWVISENAIVVTPEEVPTTTELDEGEGDSEVDEGGEETEPPGPEEPEEPSRYQTQLDSGDAGGEAPVRVVTETTPEPEEDCPMSPWMEWSPCEGPCENGKAVGYKWRVRYHLVDGVPVEKYNPHAKRGHKKSVSKYCKLKYNVFEEAECEEECETDEPEESEPTVERRIMSAIVPGGKWKSKRRDT